jgi:hypothetical protein
MNARSRSLTLGTFLALAAGCGGQGEAAPEPGGEVSVVSEVDQAVVTAKAIRANPVAADSILAAHGLTREGFDSLMYDVAADTARSRVYTEAMR